MRRRAFVLVAVLVMAASSFSTPAWAHPVRVPEAQFAGTAPTPAEAPGWSEMGRSNSASSTARSATYHRGPVLVALLAGALALLARSAGRRRTVALALAVLLGTAASEGALHALAHLEHFAHSNGLVVGLSAAQRAATDPEPAAPRALSLPLLGKIAPEPRLVPLAEVAVASDRERAPPISPA